MTITKRSASLLLFFLLTTLSAMSQSSTLSPYSMYGLGALTDQSNGASRGMNGVGQAFREGNQINYLNPASYSSVDSLTFIFDIGMSLQRTIFKENGSTKGANTADFEYFMAGFRARKHLGVGFGLVPYTNMGCNFSSKTTILGYQQYPYDIRYKKTTETATYYADGGLHEAFIGAGWEPFKGFSIGANVSFLWGTLGRTVSSVFSDTNVNSIYKIYSQKVHTYKLAFAAQYVQQINKDDNVTLGVTVTPGHQLGDEADLSYISTNTTSGISDTVRCNSQGGYTMPTEIAAGIAYKHKDRWKIGLDYSFQNWVSISTNYYIKPDDGKIVGSTGSYKNRHKINVGGEWCRNPQGRSFLDKVRCRAGISYSSPYLKINTTSGIVDGPREVAASIGFGLPIINNYNNRSVLNISFQWANESGSVIKDNTFRINIGLTFNERWFAKWKFE